VPYRAVANRNSSGCHDAAVRRWIVFGVLVAVATVGCHQGSSNEARPASPSPRFTPAAPEQVRLDCSYELFLFGPSELASNNDLSIFDPRAIAEHDAAFHGYTPEGTDACEQALIHAKARYDDASAAGWAPYGAEARWLERWASYYLCANAVIGEFKGIARELVTRKLTIRQAANRYAHETDRKRLRKPGFDGCVPGLRLGLRLRDTL
jgi:hypothetical protein